MLGWSAIEAGGNQIIVAKLGQCCALAASSPVQALGRKLLDFRINL